MRLWKTAPMAGTTKDDLTRFASPPPRSRRSPMPPWFGKNVSQWVRDRLRRLARQELELAGK
jgi:hypothetical protein